MSLHGVPHFTSSFCSTPAPMSLPTQNSLHKTGIRNTTQCATPRLGGSSGHMAETVQLTGYEQNTCIDVSRECTPIYIAVRREIFDIERDPKFAVSEDSDNLPQRAVSSQGSVATTVPALMNGSFSCTRKQVQEYESIIGSLSSTRKPVQSDESLASVERKSSRRQVDQKLRGNPMSMERQSLHDYLGGKAEMAIRGKSAAQRRLPDAEADLEIRRWEQRESEFASYKAHRKLKSQGMELHQANQWADQAQMREEKFMWKSANKEQTSS